MSEVATATIVAIHLLSHEERHYTCSPREAVMAAYAQEFGDLRTLDYEAKYGKHVQETKLGWNLGRWWARDPLKTPQTSKSELIKREVSRPGFLNKADLALIAPNTQGVTLTIYDVNEEGYITNERGRRVKDIIKDLNAALARMPWDDQGWSGDYDGFSPSYKSHSVSDDAVPFMWPAQWHWISVYAVTGASEGDYVHIDVIGRDGSREMMACYKTFGGRQQALQIANRTAILLGA